MDFNNRGSCIVDRYVIRSTSHVPRSTLHVTRHYMSLRAKKILLITGFIAIVILIGFSIWWFLFRPVFLPLPPTPAAQQPTAISGLPSTAPSLPRATITPALPDKIPSAAIEKTTPVSTVADAPVLAPFISTDGTTLQYYNRSDGKFYRLLADGSASALSDRVFFNVSNVIWANNREQAILEYPDGANILYNFTTRRQATLPAHWQKFSFSPRSEQIAFLSIGLDQDSRWLAVSSPDGAQSTAIEPLGTNASKVQVAWSPNGQIIAFSSTGLAQGVNEQEILPIGLHGENFKSLIVNGIGFYGQWSPDGKQILYSVSSGNEEWKPLVWIVEGSTDNLGAGKTSLGLNTWANKCAFGSATAVYCAVPKTLPRGAGLYPAATNNIPDYLWRVNLATGAREIISIPDKDYTIDNLVIANNESYLYFTDKISGRLYKVDLK